MMNKQLEDIYAAIKTVDMRLDRHEEDHEAQYNQQGVLIFHLPEEQNSFEIAVKALDFALAWNDLKMQIRNTLKYEKNSSLEADMLIGMQKDMARIEDDHELPELE